MANVNLGGGGHQYLGGTIQEHDKHLHQIWIRYFNYFWLLLMMDNDDSRRTTDDGQRQEYGISSPQVSLKCPKVF